MIIAEGFDEKPPWPVSSPLGSINRVAFGFADRCILLSVTALARIDFAAAKSDATNSLVLNTKKSAGDPTVARNW